MQITYLSGRRLYRAIKAGTQRVIRHCDFLNEINVFPVPDSDTGTNMAATLRAVVQNVQIRAKHSVEEAGRCIADSALQEARGNSGAILAQFFQGLAEGLRGKWRVTTKHFAQAVTKAVERSYEALIDAREGTILTVIKDWAENIQQRASRTSDFVELLRNSLVVARRSLANTPTQLKVLAKAGVVDAGAQGFVYMLEGITSFIENGKIRNLEKSELQRGGSGRMVTQVEFSVESILYRYCTEFFLVGSNISLSLLRSELKTLGDSIVVAGSTTKARIHIHTNTPRDVFDLVRDYGTVEQQKVDDMHRQHHDAHVAVEKDTIALVTDSSCDLPEEELQRYNIHVVPLRILLDGVEYIDKVTIKPTEFYERLIQVKVFPRTSQPTPGDFLRVYEQLAQRYKTIISIHISGALSGTLQAAQHAAQTIPDTKIEAIDTKTTSVALGLIVRQAGRAIKAGKSVAEVKQLIQEAIKASRIFVSVDTLKYLIKGGRVSKGRGWIARSLHLTPIISLTPEGKTDKVAFAFHGEASRRKVVKLVKKHAENLCDIQLAIVHVAAPQVAQWYREQLQGIFNVSDILQMEAAPVLGAHAGPGAAAVTILGRPMKPFIR